ncbi:MAG TPA: matrixin family metalloprotease [Blastocatellia bacterium]|nr:matrixin family metalloprotease [Blastocatellia bacterium]
MRYSGFIKITKSFVFILSISAFLLTAAGAKERAGSHKRVITVSLLNDESAPAPEDIIFRLVSAASAEYEKMVDIELKVVEYIPYSGDLTLHPMDQAFLLSRLSTKGEIRIIFSNRAGRSESDLIADKESGDHLAGASHPYFGHVIIYDVEGQAAKRDRAGNPALLTVIKHEIAHLFGVEHSEDADSFMSTPSSRSFGRWTEEVIQRIVERRQKRWFPNC